MCKRCRGFASGAATKKRSPSTSLPWWRCDAPRSSCHWQLLPRSFIHQQFTFAASNARCCAARREHSANVRKSYLPSRSCRSIPATCRLCALPSFSCCAALTSCEISRLRLQPSPTRQQTRPRSWHCRSALTPRMRQISSQFMLRKFQPQRRSSTRRVMFRAPPSPKLRVITKYF